MGIHCTIAYIKPHGLIKFIDFKKHDSGRFLGSLSCERGRYCSLLCGETVSSIHSIRLLCTCCCPFDNVQTWNMMAIRKHDESTKSDTPERLPSILVSSRLSLCIIYSWSS